MVLRFEAIGQCGSLLLAGMLRHHRGGHLAELLRICSQCVRTGVPSACLSLSDLEFGALSSTIPWSGCGSAH
jgi:hypothetical protein